MTYKTIVVVYIISASVSVKIIKAVNLTIQVNLAYKSHAETNIKGNNFSTRNVDNANFRQNRDLKFTDFILEVAMILKTYKDSFLEKAFVIIDGELWNSFSKCVQSSEVSEFKKYVTDLLKNLKNTDPYRLRKHLKGVINLIKKENYGNMANFVDFVNSLYVGKNKMFVKILLALMLKQVSPEVDLEQVMVRAIKALIADHLCGLDNGVKHELIQIIQHHWVQIDSQRSSSQIDGNKANMGKSEKPSRLKTEKERRLQLKTTSAVSGYSIEHESMKIRINETNYQMDPFNVRNINAEKLQNLKAPPDIINDVFETENKMFQATQKETEFSYFNQTDESKPNVTVNTNRNKGSKIPISNVSFVKGKNNIFYENYPLQATLSEFKPLQISYPTAVNSKANVKIINAVESTTAVNLPFKPRAEIKDIPNSLLKRNMEDTHVIGSNHAETKDKQNSISKRNMDDANIIQSRYADLKGKQNNLTKRSFDDANVIHLRLSKTKDKRNRPPKNNIDKENIVRSRHTKTKDIFRNRDKANLSSRNQNLKFTDFLLEVAMVLKTFDDSFLEEVFVIIDDELWNSFTKCIQSSELSEFKNYVSNQLNNLKNTDPLTKREFLEDAINLMKKENYGSMTNLVNFVNSLYVEENNMFIKILLALMLKRLSPEVDLKQVMVRAIKALIADHLCDLDNDVKHELVNLIKNYWVQINSQISSGEIVGVRNKLRNAKPIHFKANIKKHDKQSRFKAVKESSQLKTSSDSSEQSNVKESSVAFVERSRNHNFFMSSEEIKNYQTFDAKTKTKNTRLKKIVSNEYGSERSNILHFQNSKTTSSENTRADAIENSSRQSEANEEIIGFEKQDETDPIKPYNSEHERNINKIKLQNLKSLAEEINNIIETENNESSSYHLFNQSEKSKPKVTVKISLYNRERIPIWNEGSPAKGKDNMMYESYRRQATSSDWKPLLTLPPTTVNDNANVTSVGSNILRDVQEKDKAKKDKNVIITMNVKL